MSENLVIYGATGFTGKQLVDEALRRGLVPVLAGRSRRKLEDLQSMLAGQALSSQAVSIHAVSLDDRNGLDKLLANAAVVVNAAGPYVQTAMPLVEACLRNQADYVDVSGELPSITTIALQDARAQARSVMLMPSVGYAVAPTDSLSYRAGLLVPDAVRLRIALSHFELFAAGSAKSMISLVQNQVHVRRNSKMVTVPVGQLQADFDFGSGLSRSTAINWCDTFTAYFTSGIPNIEVYLEANAFERWLYTLSSKSNAWISQPVVQAMLGTSADMWLARGDQHLSNALKNRQRCVIVEASNADGRGVQLRLMTPEPYKVTRESTLAGFQTPATMYGDGLLQEISGSRLEQRFF